MVTMGLTPNYVPNMGVWEVAREIAANCKDADSNYQRFQNPDDPDFLDFRTSTAPRVAEVILLGCGSSHDDDDKIGQFGEGFKLAALICTRTRASKMTVLLPEHTIEFCFKDIFGETVLHAKVYNMDPAKWQYGGNTKFVCQVRMKGIRDIMDDRIIDNGATSHCWARPSNTPTTIFCKGIFICEVANVDSLYNYNLNSLTLNRDRTVATGESLPYGVAGLLLYHMTEDIADELMAAPQCWEVLTCLKSYGTPYNSKPKEMLAVAFRKRYGNDAVTAVTKPTTNLLAAARGFDVIHLPEPLAALVCDAPLTPTDLMAARVRTASTCLPKDTGFTSIASPNALYHAELAELAAIMDITQVTAEVCIFNDESKKIDGMCMVNADGCRIWLQEKLFAPGQRLERLRTMFHELAHHRADDDATPDFEFTLDLLGGKLACHILDQRAAQALVS